MSDGDQVELTPKYIKKVKTVRTGKAYIDNQLNEEIESDVVIDRQKMATEGIVMVVAQISSTDKKLIDKPKVSSFGLVADKYDKKFAAEIEEVITHFLDNMRPELINAPKRLENELRQAIRKHIFRKYKKYPTIVPTVFVM